MMNQALASMSTLASGVVETGFSAKDIVEAALNSAQGEMFAILTLAVPILAAVVTAVVGVKFGMKWLKNIGKA